MARFEAGISTVDVLRTLWRRRWVLLGVVAMGQVGTLGAILYLPPSYVAEAALLVEPRLEPAPDGSGGVIPILPDSATIDSLVQVLTSRSLAVQVLAGLPPSGGGSAAMQPRNEALAPAADPPGSPRELDRFLGGLEVARTGKSHVITVTYRSSDPVQAAAAANAVAGTFVAERQAMSVAAARRAAADLGGRLATLEAQLSASTAALDVARKDGDLANSSSAPAADEIAGLQRDLITATAERVSLAAKLARVRRADPESAGDGRGSALLENLEALKADTMRREAEDAAQYGERHPRLISVRAERAELEGRIAAEQRSVVGQVAEQVEVAQARESALTAAVAALRQQASSGARAQADLQGLERKVDLDRRLYEAQLLRIRVMAEPGANPEVRIISHATTPTDRAFPKPPLMLAIGLASSLAVALFAVFAAEQADDRLRTPYEVRTALGLPTLALVPELASRLLRGAKPQDWLLDHPASCQAEAIRTLLMGIDPRRQENGARVVLLTSAVPAEGKSTLALALARCAAVEGLRVLLIDADLRRPRLASLLDREPGVGLAELAADATTLAGVLLQDPRTSLGVIPGSAEPGPPIGLLGDKGVPAVLQAARAAYDLVIVDAAPLLPVADAARLALAVDRVVLLVRWGRTSTAVAEHAVHLLGAARDRLAGVVLSRVDLRKHRQWAKADAAVAYGRYGSYYVQ